jgi:signal transduction histidine kinase
VAPFEILAMCPPEATGTPNNDSSIIGLVALVLAVFALGRYGFSAGRDRKWAWASLTVTLLLALAGSVLESGVRLSDMVFISLFAIGPLVFGRAISVSQSAQQEAELLNERLLEQGEALREQAVQDERERIARELHDVIAHSVSLMGLQAGAARKVLPPGNEEVARSLRSIEETGRDTLNELRRMLGVMRSPDGEDDLAPQPGLASLPGLVERHRESGVDVELEFGDGLTGLSPGVDLAAYRIAQEALTNSLRHAPESAVWISTAVRAGRIDLTVESRGAQPAAGAGENGGHGIVGMTERAALYGGHVDADFVDGLGFVVHATLPAEYLRSEEPVASA